MFPVHDGSGYRPVDPYRASTPSRCLNRQAPIRWDESADAPGPPSSANGVVKRGPRSDSNARETPTVGSIAHPVPRFALRAGVPPWLPSGHSLRHLTHKDALRLVAPRSVPSNSAMKCFPFAPAEASQSSWVGRRVWASNLIRASLWRLYTHWQAPLHPGHRALDQPRNPVPHARESLCKNGDRRLLP